MIQKLDDAIENALPALEWLFTTPFEKGLVRLDEQIRRELLRPDGSVYRMFAAEGVGDIDQMAGYVIAKLATRLRESPPRD